jgi:hypothetical protein
VREGTGVVYFEAKKALRFRKPKSLGLYLYFLRTNIHQTINPRLPFAECEKCRLEWPALSFVPRPAGTLRLEGIWLTTFAHRRFIVMTVSESLGKTY